MKRWNIPGVHYPDEQPAKPRAKRRETHIDIPEGYCTSKQAAAILGRPSPAGASKYLRKLMVWTIKVDGRNLYRKREVEDIAQAVPRKIPAGYISTEEAARILGLHRSTLQRYASTGRVTRCYYIDHRSHRCSAYNEQDVRDLAQYLNYKHNNPTQK